MQIILKNTCDDIARLENTKEYPFNNSSQLVKIPFNLDDENYEVLASIVESDSDAGDVKVSDKARNGFRICFTGSAKVADIQLTLAGAEPVDEANDAPLSWKLEGNVLSFEENNLTIDLAAAQDNFPVHLDISRTPSGELVLGVADKYVAEIDIPACEYDLEYGDADDFGYPRMYKHAKELNTEEVVLTIWDEEE